MNNLIYFCKRLKEKIKKAGNIIIVAVYELVRRAKIRKSQNEVISIYKEVLGRYPDDDWTYIKGLSIGFMNVDMIKRKLMLSQEYKDRVSEYCRLSGVIEENIPHGFIPPLMPGDPLFEKDRTADNDYSTGADRFDKLVTLVSTWKIRCGIATYTEYLAREFNKTGVYPHIISINKGIPDQKVTGQIVHLQHEFGIMPKLIKTDSKILITWHTVTENISATINQFEREGNIVGHIVHSQEIADYLKAVSNSRNDIHVINHGSQIIAQIRKEDARALLGLERLGIKQDDKVGFVFGFQSDYKEYNELIEASRRTGIKLVISGAVHECGYTSELVLKDNVIFLAKYLNDTEIDLWALSSDLLILNYTWQKHYSVSGALHRTIGAGRPVICSRTNHFTDVQENIDVLKFDGQKELEQKIENGLSNSEPLGKCALEYAIKKSWENAAEKHMNIYKRHIDSGYSG